MYPTCFVELSLNIAVTYNVVMSLRAGRPGSMPRRCRDFSLRHIIWDPLSLLHSGYQGREADHSPPSNPEIENALNFTFAKI